MLQMLKKEDIDRFYKDVAMLGLKFPTAAISKATGHSKSTVSKYINKKLDPSESFLNRFYEKFPKNGKIGSNEKTGEDQLESINALISVLVSEVAALRASISGEHPEVILKKIYKAAADVRKISSGG